jgi:hypothetical protein
MTSTLPGKANDYDFGYEFDYSLWVPGTTIDLVNVPWNNDYRDVVRFNDGHGLDAYIDTLETSGSKITQLSYVKPNEPIRINIPHNRVNRYNYLRAINPMQPIDGDITKTFYYFILDTKYVAPNTTEIIIQLDVWQTYIYTATLGNCYVERGHVGIANELNFSSFGRDYLTVPEGMNIGSEYRVVGKAQNKTMDIGTAGEYVIAVLTTTKFNVNYGTVEAPALKASSGSSAFGLPSGMEIWFWESISDFRQWCNYMQDFPWIMQGIASITILPHPKRYGSWVGNGTPGAPMFGATSGVAYRTESINYGLWNNWRTSVINSIPERYRSLKKLLTYPYLAIELTTWTGVPIVLKPEAWADDNATVMERPSPMPPNQRVIYSPRRYNAIPGATIENSGRGDDSGEYLDLTVNVANFPTLPIVNSGAILYMASNARSLAYQQQSADWSQNRAIHGANIGYDQAAGAMGVNQALTQLGINADTAQTANSNLNAANTAFANTVGGIAGGAVGGGTFGGGAKGAAGGAAASGIDGLTNQFNVMQTNQMNNEALAIRNLTAQSVTTRQNQQASFVADTNKSLATWAAKGDYANQIAGINAKIQDAQLIQPNVGGQFGGETMNLLHDEVGVFARWKMIDNANIALVGEYWLRFGYSIQRFMNIPPDFKVMSKFTYWKLAQTYISAGPMPEGFKQVIRGIFEKGVTVWISPKDIGNVDIATNVPIAGIRY